MTTENTTDDASAEAINVLQQVGLKEYEAKCFVALSRLSTGTAKRLSEVAAVPRTRIYDAVYALEAQGLVEIQHSSPKEFRAVPLEEALETLRDRYQGRVGRLETHLSGIDEVERDEQPLQEVWSMTGAVAVANRTEQLIEDADEEVVFVVGHPSVLTDGLADSLNDAISSGADLIIGTVSESLREAVRSSVPGARTFVSGLEWLDGPDDSEVTIGRLLLVDRSSILVSTIDPDSAEEHAVFGDGFENGLVVVSRRLMAQGLIPTRDPSGVDG